MRFIWRFNLDAAVDSNLVTLNGVLGACSWQQQWQATRHGTCSKGKNTGNICYMDCIDGYSTQIASFLKREHDDQPVDFGDFLAFLPHILSNIYTYYLYIWWNKSHGFPWFVAMAVACLVWELYEVLRHYAIICGDDHKP